MVTLIEMGYALVVMGVMGTLWSYESWSDPVVGFQGWSVSKWWLMLVVLGLSIIGYEVLL